MDIPDTVKTLYSGIFTGSAVQSVKLPLAGMVAGSSMNNLFKDLTTLKSVTIPEGAIKLSDRMFEGCTGIESIVVPSTCMTIGSSCFGGWTKDQHIYMQGIKAPLSTWNSMWLGGTATIHWNWSPEVTE